MYTGYRAKRIDGVHTSPLQQSASDSQRMLHSTSALTGMDAANATTAARTKERRIVFIDATILNFPNDKLSSSALLWTCIHPGFPLPINVTSASVRRLQEVDNTPVTYRGRPWQTPSATPYGAGPSETPLRTPRGEPLTTRPRYDIDSSLDDFQAQYTSEDNASFTQNMDEENRKRKER
ncbi:hypothetical protein DEU56DRAFT_752411 [Suillus clintonianus]|uniref:uncharacterized protein n=1 Tax=Suillus clintonianus TaxID=1904413 RepID=UPI001B872A45|nr:uncharacterized protein DEU56DRAFT_752411 [Suillus clintonianus]KAG2151521.1 hypothetical protein DEU56DRAFT_752411 [Suillus clintonianus]